MARLIVTCGVDAPGAGRQLAEAAAGEGWRTSLIVAEAVEPRGRTGPWGVVLRVGFAAIGATVPSPAWSNLATSRDADVLDEVADALACEDVDLVVLDAGDHRAARGLIGHARSVRALLSSAIGPQVAHASAAEPDGAFALLTAAVDRAAQQERMLTDETTVWRVVTASEPASTRRAARTLAALAVLGARVDDVLLDRYPRKDFPARDRRRAAGARALLEDEIEMRTRRLRASGAVARAGESVRSTRPGQPVLTCAAPVETEGRWAWRIDLPRSARPDRVGVDAGHLVVEVDGCRRWLDLPAVLRRTVALDAVRDSSGLIVRFEPDPASWPGGR